VCPSTDDHDTWIRNLKHEIEAARTNPKYQLWKIKREAGALSEALCQLLDTQHMSAARLDKVMTFERTLGTVFCSSGLGEKILDWAAIELDPVRAPDATTLRTVRIPLHFTSSCPLLFLSMLTEK
jgi:hypothetical protein